MAYTTGMGNFSGRGRTIAPGSQTVTEEPEQSRIPSFIPVAPTHESSSTAPGVAAAPINPQNRPRFTIAIVCVLPKEYNALLEVLDGPAEFLPEDGGDFMYQKGLIAERPVVLAYATKKGQLDAALAVQSLEQTYGEMKLVILMGICAGIPTPPDNAPIYLGDVVISTAVLAYADEARKTPNDLRLRATLSQEAGRHIAQILHYLETRVLSRDLIALSKDAFERLGRKDKCYRLLESMKEEDRCFDPFYHHIHHSECPSNECSGSPTSTTICDDAQAKSCTALKCDNKRLVRERPSYKESPLNIHYGVYASADIVMRDPKTRDGLAREQKVLAFDMEATGIWRISRRAIVIKGVADYGDTHKSKMWQDVAAGHAACATRSFIQMFKKGDVNAYGHVPSPAIEPSSLSTSPNVWSNIENIQEPTGQDCNTIRVPYELSSTLESWLEDNSGANLLLYGADNHGWLSKAMRTIAFSLSHNRGKPVILLQYSRSQEVADFMSELGKGVDACLAPSTPVRYRDRLRQLNQDVLVDVEKRLDSNITILIYGSDVILEPDVGNKGAILDCLGSLLQSTRFNVLLAADYFIEVGQAPNTHWKTIEGFHKATRRVQL